MWIPAGYRLEPFLNGFYNFKLLGGKNCYGEINLYIISNIFLEIYLSLLLNVITDVYLVRFNESI
jgi:hypothetical protein